MGSPEPPIGQPFVNRLDLLRSASDGLAKLLESGTDQPESVFHEYLMENPVLLDIYGQAESKPRLKYPDRGPTGKTHVEPDFILRYWNRTYKLVELERPAHGFATQVGHPRVEVTHAAYQIAEWRDYIANHYDRIRDRFPGISTSYTSVLVIGRSTNSSFGKAAEDPRRYVSMLRQQLGVDEVLTYDDLVERANVAIRQLESLADSLAGR